jgi:hypothetical protein
MRIENYDYSYELSDEQLSYYSALPAIAKLRWLDQARRFTLLARRATVVPPSPRSPAGKATAMPAAEREPAD